MLNWFWKNAAGWSMGLGCLSWATGKSSCVSWAGTSSYVRWAGTEGRLVRVLPKRQRATNFPQIIACGPWRSGGRVFRCV